ncbi:MAG: sigma-70 family RNA polymerase sigma factor [Brevundimonas sp.]|uniref:sigma-70 family RNA polymerase sigma factor n=1 Tax=Brevundimonas sp. TaxID=1871086 RepID=UPI0039197BE6
MSSVSGLEASEPCNTSDSGSIDSSNHKSGQISAGGPDPWREDLIAMIPSLRAFAWSLSRNPSDADDLVQDTLIKAWTNRDRFQQGTNLRAWLFTILRNTWYTALSKRRREVQDSDGEHAASLTADPVQDLNMELHALQAALNTLPPEHREALVLVGAAGLSYEEAAEISGCALGTIKSRVNRARTRLAKMLDLPEENEAEAGSGPL